MAWISEGMARKRSHFRSPRRFQPFSIRETGGTSGIATLRFTDQMTLEPDRRETREIGRTWENDEPRRKGCSGTAQFSHVSPISLFSLPPGSTSRSQSQTSNPRRPATHLYMPVVTARNDHTDKPRPQVEISHRELTWPVVPSPSLRGNATHDTARVIQLRRRVAARVRSARRLPGADRAR